MVRITFTYKQIVQLVQAELNDQFASFRTSFLSKLDSTSDLMQMRTPTPTEYANALHSTSLEFNSILSTTLKHCIDAFKDAASKFVIPPTKSSKAQDHAPKGPQSSLSLANKAKTTSSQAISPGLTLSKNKTKLLRKEFQSKMVSSTQKFYRACKSDNCEVCLQIFKQAPITKCSHVSPHNHGYFPHVSRSVLRKVHHTKSYDILLTMKGIPNMLSAPAVAVDVSKMDVAEGSSRHIAVDSASSPSVSKKRRLEPDDQWSWVRELVNSRDLTFKAQTILLEYLKQMGAPAEVVKAIQSYRASR